MSFIAELKRRNVFRVAIAYVAVGWLLLQVAALLLPAFDLPNTHLRVLIGALALGFIPALVFAWVYELTPEGLKRESEIDRTQSVTHLTGRKLDFLVIGVLGAIVALLLVDKFVVTPRQAANTSDTASSRRTAEPGTRPANDASIAVLPFIDLSQAKDQEYFSDGLSEELLDLLAKVPDLRVIARTSSFSFKGKDADIATIAAALKVAHVLEGSVRKSGNTLRITAQLIRTADSSHVWSETYDRELTDVFKVQDEIAAAVVGELKLKLLAGARDGQTASPAAHEQFLIGHAQFLRNNNDGYLRSAAAFRKALELDPGYAEAYAGLARTLVIYSDFLFEPEAIAAMKREAEAAAEKAVALGPDSWDAHEARAFIRSSQQWDWKGAEADLERALALAPGSAVAHARRAAAHASLARFPEAIAEVRKALELDPLSAADWNSLSVYLFQLEGASDAVRDAQARATTLNPESGFAWTNAGVLELAQGHLEGARSAFARAGEVWEAYGKCLVEHAAGNTAAAQAALDDYIKRYAAGSAFQIAEIYAFRGETEKAFEWLDRAFKQRDGGLSILQYSLYFKPLRGDMRRCCGGSG